MSKRATDYEGGAYKTQQWQSSLKRSVMRKRAYLMIGYDMSCDSVPLMVKQ
jgi:hypothetical protein